MNIIYTTWCGLVYSRLCKLLTSLWYVRFFTAFPFFCSQCLTCSGLWITWFRFKCCKSPRSLCLTLTPRFCCLFYCFLIWRVSSYWCETLQEPQMPCGTTSVNNNSYCSNLRALDLPLTTCLSAFGVRQSFY